jgi:hypothetical protein
MGGVAAGETSAAASMGVKGVATASLSITERHFMDRIIDAIILFLSTLLLSGQVFGL